MRTLALSFFLFLLAACGESEPAPNAAPVVVLPTPAAAVHAPLAAPPATALEWRWLHPRPRAMPRWNDIDAGFGQAVMVGPGGYAALLSDAGMRRWPTGTEQTLHGVALLAQDVGFAVGEGGTLVALLASGARALSLGTEATLRAIASYGPTEAVVVGDGGALYRLEHLAPRALTLPAAAEGLALFGVHLVEEGRSGRVVGRDGLILRLDGDEVTTERAPRGPSLRAITRCARAGWVAVGDAGLVVHVRDGNWERVPTQDGAPLTDVGCFDGFAIASTARGGALLIDGLSAVAVAGRDELAFRGVSARPASDRVWFAGDAGRIAYFEGDHLVSLTEGTAAVLTGAAELAGELVAVGYWGVVLRLREGRFESLESPSQAGLAGVAAIGPGELVAVGEAGTMLSISHRGVAPVLGSEGATEVSLHAVLGDVSGSFVAVGDGGTIVRGQPGSVRAERLFLPELASDAPRPTLYAIGGSVDGLVAAGAGGALLRLGAAGAPATRLASCTDVALRAVMVERDAILAAGEDGTIVRVVGGECARERSAPGEGTLFALGRDPEGRPLAAGEHGRVLVRSDTGEWRELELDVGGHALRAATRDARGTYLLGSGGTILRHARVDGQVEGAGDSPAPRTPAGAAG